MFGCSSDEATASANDNQNPDEVQASGYSDFISKTVAYPIDYAQVAGHQGTVHGMYIMDGKKVIL